MTVDSTSRTPRAKAWSKTPGLADRNAEILRLWGQGKSAAEIAAALGSITRNAVIGIVHRAGHHRGPKVRRAKPAEVTQDRPPTPRPSLPGKPAARKPAGRDHFADVGKMVVAPPLAPIAPEIPGAAETSDTAVPFLDRRFGQCVWPLWQAPTDARLVCGAPVAGDGPYCPCHTARATRPPTGGERRLERLK